MQHGQPVVYYQPALPGPALLMETTSLLPLPAAVPQWPIATTMAPHGFKRQQDYPAVKHGLRYATVKDCLWQLHKVQVCAQPARMVSTGHHSQCQVQPTGKPWHLVIQPMPHWVLYQLG